jgi:hypothetical protein
MSKLTAQTHDRSNISKPSLSFRELFDDMSENWEKKAKDLQARRWNHIHSLINQ